MLCLHVELNRSLSLCPCSLNSQARRNMSLRVWCSVKTLRRSNRISKFNFYWTNSKDWLLSVHDSSFGCIDKQTKRKDQLSSKLIERNLNTWKHNVIVECGINFELGCSFGSQGPKKTKNLKQMFSVRSLWFIFIVKSIDRDPWISSNLKNHPWWSNCLQIITIGKKKKPHKK